MANRTTQIQAKRRRKGDFKALTDARGKIIGYQTGVTIGKDLNGKQVRRYVTAKTKSALQDVIAQVRVDTNNGTLSDTRNRTVGNFLTEWLEFKRSEVRPITHVSYERTVQKNLLPIVQHIKLKDFSAFDVDQIHKTLRERGLSSRSIGYAHTLMRGALSYAVSRQILPRNVVECVKPPKNCQEEMKVWNPAEVRRFLTFAANEPMGTLFHLVLLTGLRRSEVLGLKWRHVALASGLIHIRETLVEIKGRYTFSEPKTQKGRRNIHISADLVTMLERHQQKQREECQRLGDLWQDHDLVFPSEIGTPKNPANMARTFKSLIKKAGVPNIRFHDLRHTHASTLILQGIDITMVSDRLGHEKTSFTLDTYVHVFDGQRQKLALNTEQLYRDDVSSRIPATPMTIPN